MTLDDLEALAKATLETTERGSRLGVPYFSLGGAANAILDLIRRVREAEWPADGSLPARCTPGMLREWSRLDGMWQSLVRERDAALAKLAEAEAARDKHSRLRVMWRNQHDESHRQSQSAIAEAATGRPIADELRTERDTALARVREVEAERDALAIELRGVHGLRSDEASQRHDYETRLREMLEAAQGERDQAHAEVHALLDAEEPSLAARAHRRAQQAESRATKEERATATLQARLDGAIAKLASERQDTVVWACDRFREAVLDAARFDGERTADERVRDVVKVAREFATGPRPKDEARYLAVAEALGIVYEADGHATEAGPLDAVLGEIKRLHRIADREIERDLEARTGEGEAFRKWLGFDSDGEEPAEAPIPDAPPSDGGARQMDEAIARREARIAELEDRVEAAKAKLALVRAYANATLDEAGAFEVARRLVATDVLAILGGE